MKRLRIALSEGSVILDLEARDIESILRKTLDATVERGLLPADQRQAFEAALIERERQISTAIGNSVAIPHAYLDTLEEPLIVFVRLARPVNLGAPDGIPTRFLFVLLGPTGAAIEHLDTLAGIARLMSDDEFRYDARWARSHENLIDALERYLARTAPAVLEEPTEAPVGLAHTGRLFGGLRDDVRRRLAYYISDFRDGLNPKSLSSTLFLFFACLAPAVTFGGIMGAQTEGQIGVVEMLVASAACGIAYALLSGQPLIILGGVGPLLVFTAILYRLCNDMEIAFLPGYAWVGFWTSVLLVIMAATDASCLMRHFTRFTDEIFSALMALIFIYEAIKALVSIFHKSFADESVSHDAAFLSLILAIGTFYIAISLSQIRRSRYLLPWMRAFLADFGPMIALAAMTLVSWLYHGEVMMETLQAPDTIRTTTERAWMIDPFAAPMWVRVAAIGPAILAAVLVFLTQNITARLINSPDHKLQKGPGYHLDLAVVGGLIGVCSLFGLPWLVAATVRSLAHVRGLATLEEVITPDGATSERVTHVEETRVTGLAIHLLIAVSLLLLPALKVVPMSVLYGIFLFMGVVSLAGNQFFERITLWVMDPDLYPRTHYIRQSPVHVIHKFTFIQLACLGVLCAVTLSSYELLRLSFPLFIAMLIPARFFVGRLFSAEQLESLDAEETPRDETTHWSA
ncbi:MAG: PTS sugar transporter subunit IIA [Planctomycetaceae bacterium]|nr:PTS sugar transporter subunit IIA [Planctomycetaceae bacterium]